jgi:hypothetical protein
VLWLFFHLVYPICQFIWIVHFRLPVFSNVYFFSTFWFWKIYSMHYGDTCSVYLSWSHHSKVLRSPPWHGWSLCNIGVTNDQGYLPLVVNTSRSFPRSWIITGVVTRIMRRVYLVEQELLTLPEHLSSSPFLVGSCYSIFDLWFYVYAL